MCSACKLSDMYLRLCMHMSLMVHLDLLVVREDHFEEFWRSGHLMVPWRSAAFLSMYGTILVAVGQHRSVRPTGVTSLHVGLESHALVLSPVGHISHQP